MKILLYHKNLHSVEKNILERASQRKHMLKKTMIWDILLFILIGIGSTLIWIFSPVLAQIPMLSMFIPVRMSIWEHLKLLYFPTFFIAFARYLFMGNLQKGILTTYAQGVLLAMSVMTAGHYIITGILGKLFIFTDIIFFYFSMLILIWYLRTHADRQKKSSLSGFLILFLITVCFFYFTYHMPLELGIFQEIILQSQ
ncbi:MAG: hypothetical protein K2K06_04945 [Oscillospiraceae bacterium]|nr:hypothetical protein [Ruminococcus sp.]MDE6707369.1 hypothetical protein [Oscillospiraceae bacterium]